MTPKIKKLRINALVLLGSVLLLGLTLLCACRQSVGKAGSAFWASAGAEADSVSARLDESARGDFDTERRQAGELLQEMSEGEACKSRIKLLNLWPIWHLRLPEMPNFQCI